MTTTPYEQTLLRLSALVDELHKHAHAVDEVDRAKSLSPAAIEAVKRLAKAHVVPLQMLGLLVHALPKEELDDFLRDRFLHPEVRYTSAYGGREFLLTSLLDDYLEKHGREALVAFLATCRPSVDEADLAEAERFVLEDR